MSRPLWEYLLLLGALLIPIGGALWLLARRRSRSLYPTHREMLGRGPAPSYKEFYDGEPWRDDVDAAAQLRRQVCGPSKSHSMVATLQTREPFWPRPEDGEEDDAQNA